MSLSFSFFFLSPQQAGRKEELSGICCQWTVYADQGFITRGLRGLFPVANLADSLTTWWMFTLAHMGVCQLTESKAV